MEKNKQQVPRLRFPGFNDAWEQRKLNEISQKVIEKNVNNLYQETFTNSAEFGVINQRDFFDKDISNKANLAGYYVVQNNDFVYNPRISNFAPVGPIKRNKLGRSGVMSPLYHVFRVEGVDYQFLETYFENTQWHIFMKENGDSGARSDRFAIKDSVFFKMPISLPSKQEQTAISDFFRQLDAAIASHQRKLERVKKLKKSLLQKMFPKDGEAFPELRFPDFTDAWEQRKLGELGEFNPKSNLPEEFEYVDLESVIGTTLVNHRTELKESAPSRAQRLAQYGDVFYQTVRPYQRNNYLYVLPYENYVFSTGYAQIRPCIDSYFLLSCLQEDQFVNRVLDNCTGTSYPAINSTDLAEIKVDISVNKQEQTTIGDFFRQLDAAIASHQRKA